MDHPPLTEREYRDFAQLLRYFAGLVERESHGGTIAHPVNFHTLRRIAERLDDAPAALAAAEAKGVRDECAFIIGLMDRYAALDRDGLRKVLGARHLYLTDLPPVSSVDGG